MWKLTHAEPYLRKTFTGGTLALCKHVSDYLNDDTPLPELNKNEPPGYGPEMKK